MRFIVAMRCATFLALICGVLSTCTSTYYCISVEYEALQEFAKSNRRFTAGVYKELIKQKSGNIIVSPLSAETVLALTSEGARGETATEFLTGLSLPSSREKTQMAFKNLLPKLKRSDKDLKLLSANKIYAGKDVKLNPDFYSIATTVYDSSIENVNFAENIQAAKTINNWVEDNTNHKIKDLISPNILSEDTRLVLVNALYFNGKWASEFDEGDTRKKKFHKTKDDTVDVDTMHQKDFLNYYEDPTLNAKFLELPYEGGDVSMVIVLPNEIDGLARLEQNIVQVLQPQPFTKELVVVDLPKFIIETQIDFVPILKNLGIQRLFDYSSDLSGLSSTGERLYVSNVIQKAFINVTESGTEAAAATAVLMIPTSAIFDPSPSPKKYYFPADRPFLYYIKVKPVPTNDGIVFGIGHVTEP